MCFGSKKEISDAPAPRPAPSQAPQQPPSFSQSQNQNQSYANSNGNAKNTTSHQPPDSNSNVYATAQAGPSGQSSYPPPAQPPPSGPPQYDMPPGGPPPPIGSDLPPSYDNAPPSYGGSGGGGPPNGNIPTYDSVGAGHDWQNAVPDTSLFPPPPALFSGFEQSPSSNATEAEAIAGEEWCEQYPLTAPMVLDDASRGALHFNNIRLMEPTGFKGELTWIGPGHWQAKTGKKSPDRCLISYPPLYAVRDHDPRSTGQPRTIYYEVHVRPESPTVFVAMGFTALPYPSFRMPGWHRGSLAVHGDDGHKYVNDRWGGKEFTREFVKGETYGIGMTIRPTEAGAPGNSGEEAKPLVDIFFTRNGELAGGWNIHEETDAEEDLPVTGLEGLHDLCAAVGTYDGTKIEIIFEPTRWLYQGV